MSGVGTLGVGAITTSGALVGAVSQDAFNTVSTTLNLGGAATTVNIGAATGTLTVANATLAAKAVTATAVTNSALTATRLVYSGTAGLEVDSANLTFNGTILTSTGFAGPLNGTVGATTPAAGAFTTLSTTGAVTLSGGTANGVAYLDGSKVLTTGSALTFDGTNLGIGTASPASPLQINSALAPTSSSIVRIDNTATTAYSGTGYVGGQIRINFTNATGRYAGINFSNTGATSQEFFGAVQNASGYNDFVWQGFSGSYLERMRLDSSGNLGLGVTPSAWGSTKRALQVGNATAIWQDGSGAGSVGYVSHNVYDDGTSEKYIFTDEAEKYLQAGGQHQWFIAASGTAGNAITFTQAMTLDASGNLLVGTTSTPTGAATGIALAFNGQAYFSANQTSTFFHQLFYNNNGLVGSIVTNGSVTTYNTTSDYRLKTVIGPVADAGSRIDALQPVEYTWNSNGTSTRGFLAHQFQEVYAGSVTGTKDAVDAEGKPVYQAMQASTPEVIADLIAEIQDLRKRLAAAGI
jgi:hypothetical protein